MSTSLSTPAVQYTRARLLRDISELLSTPYPGVEVHVAEEDITKLCLLLSPVQGPYKGLTLHFEVTIPENFPLAPPVVKNSTVFEHPNVFGNWICCDILKGEEEMRGYRYGDYTGGFTPAYSLFGIFMQLASFFSDERVEQSGGYVRDISTQRTSMHTVNRFQSAREAARNFTCKKCGYGITRSYATESRRDRGVPGAARTSLSLAAPLTNCALERLPSDCLLHILDVLPTSDVLVFARAYKPVSALISRYNIIAQREVRCFVLKKSSAEAIIGVGIEWSRDEKAFVSPFDYISIDAFQGLGIRVGVRREQYTHFLPLAINASHFQKASSKVVEQLGIMQRYVATQSNRAPPPSSGPNTNPYSYKLVCSFANNIVVKLMQSCDGPDGLRPGQTLLHASERALTDYFSLMHLLISLGCSYPAIVQSATAELNRFIRTPSARVKSSTPNLGELIVQRVLVPSVPWADIRLPLLGETLTRNVVWMLDTKKGAGKGELAFIEQEDISNYRLETTFQASKTSLKLLMFQHFFLEKLRGLVPPKSNLPTLKAAIDARFGLPPPNLPAELVAAIKEIKAVKNFAEFSVRLSLPPPAKSWMTSYLRDRIAQSESQGYHAKPPFLSPQVLTSWRASQDREWASAHPNVRPAVPTPGFSFFPNFTPDKKRYGGGGGRRY